MKYNDKILNSQKRPIIPQTVKYKIPKSDFPINTHKMCHGDSHVDVGHGAVSPKTMWYFIVFGTICDFLDFQNYLLS